MSGPELERHRIVDFAFDPVDRQLWVELDANPSRAWTDAFELLVVHGVSGAAVGHERRRLSLPIGKAAECDALGILVELIDEATATINSTRMPSASHSASWWS